MQPSIGQEEIDAVVEVMNSGWLGLGPKTEQFEQEFAEYVGNRYMVGLNSGTAALHLALEAYDIGPGDEVIVPPMTFISTVHAVSYVGATPVFADVETDTMNISVIDIERKITDRTKAIIVVHLAGHPCDMDAIHELAAPKGIKVIEDAAHACGASYKGRKIGSISEMTCFSFHAVKNLTCGEGGGITCHQEMFAKDLREKRWVGISKNTWSRSSTDMVYAWQYFVNQVGYKYHMDDMKAAMGLVQLRKLEKLNGRRQQIAAYYHNHLSQVPWVELPLEKPYAHSSWHLFQIKLPDQENRDRLIGHMKDDNIAPGVHYYPCHLHPCYQHIEADVPVSEKVWKTILTLPIHPNLTDEDLERVVDCLHRFEL